MRRSLIKSTQDSPVRGFERYPKGSIICCTACMRPVFKLDRAICVGDKGGMAAVFVPLSATDLQSLSDRTDIDPGLRALVRGWNADQRKAHLACLRQPRNGDAMKCPACQDGFAQVLAVEASEVIDKAYVIELLAIPPIGAGSPITLKNPMTSRWKSH